MNGCADGLAGRWSWGAPFWGVGWGGFAARGGEVEIGRDGMEGISYRGRGRKVAKVLRQRRWGGSRDGMFSFDSKISKAG